MKKFQKNLKINIIEDAAEEVIAEPYNQSIVNSGYRRTENESDEEKSKCNQPISKSNIIEFEEFCVDEQNHSDDNFRLERELKQKQQPPKKTSRSKAIKQFKIEIPQIKDPHQQPISMSNNKNISNMITEIHEREDYRQPPAPSHKAGFKNKSFVFPIAENKTSIKSMKNSHQIQTYEVKMEELLKSFDRERQEFYKQKSKYEKELMVREGQIEMMQKIITNGFNKNDKSDIFHQEKQYEQLILEKDLQMTELLEKINNLNIQLEDKSDELTEVKQELGKIQTISESLKNQIYIYEKKQANQKITKQFFLLKNNPKATTPKAKWEEGSFTKREDSKMNGFHDLQKRLQNLKNNRIDFEDRHKIKSQMIYCQTTKNKNNTTFDFKGAYYDRQREYNRSKF